LEASKRKPLRRWIHGFGIKFIGKKISQDLALGFSSRIEEKEYTTDSRLASYLLQYAGDSEYLETLFGL
jgi:NAD-dependent DNA ligase